MLKQNKNIFRYTKAKIIHRKQTCNTRNVKENPVTRRKIPDRNMNVQKQTKKP